MEMSSPERTCPPCSFLFQPYDKCRTFAKRFEIVNENLAMMIMIFNIYFISKKKNFGVEAEKIIGARREKVRECWTWT